MISWRTFFLIFCGLLIGTIGSIAQGLVFDEAVYGKSPMQSEYGDGAKSEAAALRNIGKVSLRPYCPEIRNQGTISSCVGWASGYTAYSIQQAIINEWRGLKDVSTKNATSAMFLYNQIKIYDCEYGSRISDAMKFLKETGNVLHTDFDNELENCYIKPDSTLVAKAKKHKIKRFEALFKSKAREEVKVTKTKLSLIQNRPVIVGFNLLNSFARLRKTDEYWYPEIGDKSEFGGHAMVVIGFDDSKANGEGAFEIMNSWGENWGKEGFIWVKYSDYAKYCMQAFHMILFDEIKQDLIYTGEANLKRLVMVNADGPVFDDEQFQLKDGIYKLNRTLAAKKGRFQLEVTNVNNGMSLYVFSVDANNELKIHWPRDQAIDNKFEGLHESAGITVPEVKLILPTPKSALQFSQVGEEYLIALYCQEPIVDINERLQRFEQAEGNIKQKLNNAFGALLVPNDQINYNKSRLRFQNQISNGQVIPVVMALPIQ